MRLLRTLKVENYKSIRAQTLELSPLNIFIGGNGAGKSNLVSIFRFLREIVTQNLAGYTAAKGGADALLYFGRKVSKKLSLSLTFGEGNTTNGYRVVLVPTADDGFVIEQEVAEYHEVKKYPTPYNLGIAFNAPESKLREASHICARQALRDLESYRVYHFHDTSDSSTVKSSCDLNDNRYLRSQAENLAAFLYWIKQTNSACYQQIVGTIRQVAPFFDDFQLAPLRLNESRIRLEWKEKGNDEYFNAHALSDGTLRFICLATLLLQPTLPSLVLLDEPELGLHPAAINLLADLLSSAATRAQVVVSTQSVTLINQFGPDVVWAVDKRDGQSEFVHLAAADMSNWLESYSLGELWEKNLVGARP